MGQSVRQRMLVVGLGLASPFAGMVGCEDSSGGIMLPAGDSAGQGGSSHAKGGSTGMELAGEGGNLDAGAAGSSVAANGGKAGSQSGAGGTHTHGSGGSNSGKGGSSKGGSGNTGNTGNTDNGTAGDGEAGDTHGTAGAAGESEVGGEGGAVEPGTGGTGGTGGTSSEAGTGGTGGVPPTNAGPLANCIYASDPVVDVPAAGGTGGVGGMGGTGGAAGASQNPHGVNVVNNAFLGPYLTDQAGFALYIYSADFPGDCEHPPVSNCVADCAQSWPIFNANERALGAGLDNAMFGTLDRGDGTHQTTYKGWPLYYYKSDTAPNVINGQGKGKIWFAAEVVLPNLLIMRGPAASGGVKFLGDDSGWTLYSLAGDTPGTSSTAPVSSCTGSCLYSFTPFSGGGDVFPCTSLEPHDVSLFLRSDGMLQAAYKGVPLYYSHDDTRSGDENGVGVLGGAVVLP